MRNNSTVLLFLRLSLLFWEIYTLRSLEKKKDSPPDTNVYILNVQNFKLCFLTIWVFICQMVFIVISILDEFSATLRLPAKLRKLLSRFRSTFYHAIVFPSCLFVCSTFWIIWHIDRELVFPKVIDEFLSSTVNHTLHTLIIAPLIIESFLARKKEHLVSFGKLYRITLAFSVAYLVTYFSVYFRHGVWLYPFFYIISWPQQVLFAICSILFSLFYMKVGVMIQNVRTGDSAKKVK